MTRFQTGSGFHSSQNGPLFLFSLIRIDHAASIKANDCHEAGTATGDITQAEAVITGEDGTGADRAKIGDTHNAGLHKVGTENEYSR